MTYNLNHASFEVVDEGIRYFRGEKATVLICAERLGGCRQLCQITYNRKTGAVYAQFTYFKKGRGIVANVSSRIQDDMSAVVDFSEKGLVTSTAVKYSHPPDGRAHFSQDGRIVTKVWSESLPLTGPEGHLFEIHAYHLSHFAPLIAGKERRNRIYLPFLTDSPLSGVSVSVEWRRKDAIKAEASRRGTLIGPVADIPRRGDRKLFRAALFAPPESCALQEHVLAVNVHPLEAPAAITDPTLVFFGGWKHPPEQLAAGNIVRFLSFQYPVSDDAAFAQSIGSLDLPANPA